MLFSPLLGLEVLGTRVEGIVLVVEMRVTVNVTQRVGSALFGVAQLAESQPVATHWAALHPQEESRSCFAPVLMRHHGHKAGAKSLTLSLPTRR